ncbi:hypothetical protein PSZ44_23930, partial [Shigella flexneri]|nr:hypothetical protein [Shigella flexneri]
TAPYLGPCVEGLVSEEEYAQQVEYVHLIIFARQKQAHILDLLSVFFFTHQSFNARSQTAPYLGPCVEGLVSEEEYAQQVEYV